MFFFTKRLGMTQKPATAGGAIEMEEFLLGCLRLRGQARALDIAKLMYDQNWLVQSQGKFPVCAILEKVLRQSTKSQVVVSENCFTPRNGQMNQMIQLHEHLFQSGSTSNSKRFLFKHTHFFEAEPLADFPYVFLLWRKKTPTHILEFFIEKVEW